MTGRGIRDSKGPGRGRSRCSILVALVLLSAAPDAGGAQTRRRIDDPSGHPFRPPTVSPLEPNPRLILGHLVRDTVSRGTVFLDLGGRLPLRLAGSPSKRWSLSGALAAGAHSAFTLGLSDNQFVEVRYRVAVQLRARVGAVAARLELYHASSHLGDEFIILNFRLPSSSSREGLELLVQTAPASGLLVYGGPGALIGSKEELAWASIRAGFEWEAAGLSGGVAPYVALDGHAWAEHDWDPSLTAEAGAAIGPRLRIGVTLGLGPSRMEQFFRESERLLGLSGLYQL